MNIFSYAVVVHRVYTCSYLVHTVENLSKVNTKRISFDFFYNCASSLIPYSSYPVYTDLDFEYLTHLLNIC